jgi:hypothetical protein
MRSFDGRSESWERDEDGPTTTRACVQVVSAACGIGIAQNRVFLHLGLGVRPEGEVFFFYAPFLIGYVSLRAGVHLGRPWYSLYLTHANTHGGAGGRLTETVIIVAAAAPTECSRRRISSHGCPISRHAFVRLCMCWCNAERLGVVALRMMRIACLESISSKR